MDKQPDEGADEPSPEEGPDFGAFMSLLWFRLRLFWLAGFRAAGCAVVGTVVVAVVSVLYVVGYVAWATFTTPPSVSPSALLPAGAVIIHEELWEEGFLPDFHYCLQARVTKEDFASFVSKIGLKLDETPKEHWNPCISAVPRVPRSTSRRSITASATSVEPWETFPEQWQSAHYIEGVLYYSEGKK